MTLDLRAIRDVLGRVLLLGSLYQKVRPEGAPDVTWTRDSMNHVSFIIGFSVGVVDRMLARRAGQWFAGYRDRWRYSIVGRLDDFGLPNKVRLGGWLDGAEATAALLQMSGRFPEVDRSGANLIGAGVPARSIRRCCRPMNGPSSVGGPATISMLPFAWPLM